MQHAIVPTLENVAATCGSTVSLDGCGVGVGVATVNAGLVAARGRLSQLRSARRAYAAAVHLDPRVAGLWGDLGLSYHLQVELEAQHPALASASGDGQVRMCR